MRQLGFKLIVSMAALLLAAIAVFAAAGFACLSLYLYLTTLMAPALAALATAFSALLFALIVVALANALVRRPFRRRRADESDVFAGLEEAISLGKALGLESRGFMTSHLSKASMVVFGLGFAMGLSPKLRKLITDLLLR